jgi:hypothetical protein
MIKVRPYDALDVRCIPPAVSFSSVVLALIRSIVLASSWYSHTSGHNLGDTQCALGTFHGVLEQHGDSHWPHTAGHRGDESGDLLCLGKINIAC